MGKKNGKKVAVCKCGYVSKEKPGAIKEEIKKDSVDVAVVKDNIETLPKIEETCSKCGHHTAFYWTIQTRAGDEGETKFLKCEKCNHTWRDYG